MLSCTPKLSWQISIRTDLWISSFTSSLLIPRFLYQITYLIRIYLFLFSKYFRVLTFPTIIPSFLKKISDVDTFFLKRTGCFFVNERSWYFLSYDQKVLTETLLLDGCFSSGMEVGNSDKWSFAWLTSCWFNWKPPIFLVDFGQFFKSLG